jgi:hypothetical protein
MDIILDDEHNITSISYSNALIRVSKNFAYEEHSLLDDPEYQFIFDTTKKMFDDTRHKFYFHI